MFWGLQVNAGEASKVIEADGDLRLSMIYLHLDESSNAVGQWTQLFVKFGDNPEFLVANLSASNPDWSVDLEFEDGEQVAFTVKGSGSIHLTGCMDNEDEVSVVENSSEEIVEQLRTMLGSSATTV